MPYFILFFLFISTPLQAQKLDASYEGEELLLVEGYSLLKKGRYKNNKIAKWLSRQTPEYSLSKPFYHIYWNPQNNRYYYAKAGSLLTKTNGLRYKLNPAKTNATLVYHPKATYHMWVNGQNFEGNIENIEKLFARNLQPNLAFAGWISSNQRLLIHIPTQTQYLQTLTFIDDPYEVVPWLSFQNDWPVPFVQYDLVDKFWGFEPTSRLDEGDLLLRD